MHKFAICTVITTCDPALVENVSSFTDIFELRLDLIGGDWQKLLQAINKPWIAACRPKDQGGAREIDDSERTGALMTALEAGADMIDLELSTPGIEDLAPAIKKKARLILSFHDFNRTPELPALEEIASRQFGCGADIAKIATLAPDIEANLRLLELVKLYKSSVVAVGMGARGLVSRVMCPVYGGAFTYASAAAGLESAPGQLTAFELRHIYRLFEL